MCFKNLPIEFDANGKAHLREGAADPYALNAESRPPRYVRRREGPGAQLAAPPRLERIRRVAGDGPWPLNDLCDHLLDACENDLGRSDDVCLLGLRLRPDIGSGLRAAS